MKIEKSSFRKFSIFSFFLKFFDFVKNFEIFRKFSKIFVPQKIFWILCCNFTSNKSIFDFLDIFRCRFVTRRRWNRLKRAPLQSATAHKKKNSAVIFSVFVSGIPAPGCSGRAVGRLPIAHHGVMSLIITDKMERTGFYWSFRVSTLSKLLVAAGRKN